MNFATLGPKAAAQPRGLQPNVREKGRSLIGAPFANANRRPVEAG